MAEVGILGGTGPAGRALGTRLAACGVPVVLGSRAEERAVSAAAAIREAWPGRELPVTGGPNAVAAAASVVVVATPWDGAGHTAGSLAEVLSGKVVISMANALTRSGTELQSLVPARGSVAAEIQAQAPAAHVAAAFHHLPARDLGDLGHELDADVLVCSDHREATEEASRLVGLVPGLRALDAGSLASAAALEAFTAVLVNLNIRYGAHAGVRITGVRNPA